MLARCERAEPARMRAPSAVSNATCSALSCSVTVTPLPSGRLSEPFAPLIVTRPAAIVAETPCGRLTGFLATRDILSSTSGHDAQDFAALADGPGLAVGHHALRRGNDDRSHATEHLGQLVLAAIDAQSGAADALEAVDNRPALVVLQVDGQARLAGVGGDMEIRHVALVLQDTGNRRLDLRRIETDMCLACALSITDAGQQVGNGIGHAHATNASYQLDFTRPGISPRLATSRILVRARPNLRYTPRGRPVSAQRLRWREGLASRGCFCSFACASVRASSEVRGLRISSLSCARFAAYFSTVFVRRFSRSTMLVLAMPSNLCPSLLAEREIECFQQRPTVFIGRGGRGDGDVHATQLVDLVVLDLGEDDLFLHAEGVVAAAVEGARGNTTEVAHARQR